MDARVPARLTAAEGRKFGFTVGAAFLALAAIAWWRGRVLPEEVFGALGALLIAAALLAPSYLGPVQRAWMAMARAISRVTTPLFMGIVYFVVITPLGAVMRLAGKNPLAPSTDGVTYWRTRDATRRRSDLERQF